MKKIISALVLSCFILPTFSFAGEEVKTCRDLYQEKVWDISSEGGSVFVTAWLGGFIGGATAGLSGALFGLAIPVAGITGTVLIHNAKPKKMINLIDDAEAYTSNPDSLVIGKRLAKLHKKLKKEGSISIEDLARKISDGNRNFSFCTVDILSYRQLKKAFENNDLKIINND